VRRDGNLRAKPVRRQVGDSPTAGRAAKAARCFVPIHEATRFTIRDSPGSKAPL